MADDKKPTTEELQAQKDLAEAEKRAKEAADANAARELAAKMAEKGTGYVVSPNMSLSTIRGIVDAGCSVSARDFNRVPEDFNELVDRGAIVKK